MSYQQAFHTCCRDGLTTPNLGFQYQAASSGLNRDQLTALARQLAGYLPGPSAPPTPDAIQIAEFPISLRYFQVLGVGAAVSQTVYVGREDRATNSGRFGNYFTHIVTSPGKSVFDDARRPIVLWQSPVWRTDAGPSDATELDSLSPGQASEAAAQQLLSDPLRRAWFAKIHDWLGDVTTDRSRIVVLEDAYHGWAWVAALTLSLPALLGEQISFDTFTGEPDRSTARICVADPAFDRAVLRRHELTGELHVVDLQEAPPEPHGLLARAVAAGRRHACGAEIDDELSLDEVAVLMAADGPQPMPVEAHDVGTVLATITHWLDVGEPHAGDLGRAASLVDEAIYDEADLGHVDRNVLEPLWAFTAQHPGAAPEPVQTLALRLALVAPGLTTDVPIPQIGRSGASPEVVGAGIGLMSREGVAPATQSEHLRLLSRTGLVGVNSALDRRIGAVAANCIDEPGVVDWLTGLAADSTSSAVLEEAIRGLSQTARFNEPVLALLSDYSVGRIHLEISGRGEAFPITYARVVACGYSEPGQRRQTLEWALGWADSPAEAESLIEAVYGDRLSPEALRTVLSVLSSAGRRPGPQLIEDGWRMLEKADPFSGDPTVHALASDLDAIDQSGRTRSIYLAISLEQERERAAPAAWLMTVAKCSNQLNDLHLTALLRREIHGVGEGTIAGRNHTEMVRVGVKQFGQRFIDCYWEELTWALRDVTNVALAVETMEIWISADSLPMSVSDAAIDEWFPKALGPWSEDARAAIGDRLRRDYSAEWVEWWDGWREDHPASGALGRQFRRIRARRPNG